VVPVGGFTWSYKMMGNPYNPSYIVDYMAAFTHSMTFWERLRNTISSIGSNTLLDNTMTREYPQDYSTLTIQSYLIKIVFDIK
jgi:hypothetical protein